MFYSRINFAAPKMKAFIAIFFITLLGVKFSLDMYKLTGNVVICMDIEEEKNNDKQKDTKKDKIEEKEFCNEKKSKFTSYNHLADLNSRISLILQQAYPETLTPPPDHC